MPSYHIKKRAFHATASRLVATLINERLLTAILHFFPGNPNLILLLPTSLCETTSQWPTETSALTMSIIPEAINSMYLGRISLPREKKWCKLQYIDPKDIFPGIKRVFVQPHLQDGAFNNVLVSMTENISSKDLSLTDIMSIATFQMTCDEKQLNRICKELEDSYMNQVNDYSEKKNLAPTLSSSLLDWEKVITEGHATHPMHRTRLPNPPVVLPKLYDLATPFIKLLSIPRDKVQVGGEYESLVRSWLVHVLNRPELEQFGVEREKDRILIPYHSIQSNILFSMFPDAKDFPSVNVMFDAQMSFRTVQPKPTPLSEASQYHLKLPVNLTTTSATRTVSPYSIHNGPVISTFIKEVLKDRETLFVCGEVGSVGIALNEEEGINVFKARNLGAIIRQNPESHLKGECIIPCASLVENGPDGNPHVLRVFNLSTQCSRISFLKSYASMLFSVFLPPLIENGFAFEAHGQNTLLRWNKVKCCIAGFAVRDFGGIRIHKPSFEKSTNLSTDVIMKDSGIVFEQFEDVASVLYHTVIQCQLHRLIRALDLHHNGIGWNLLRELLQPYFLKAKELQVPFEETWMQPNIRYKSFIRMKLDSLYRDYLYSSIPNLLLYPLSRDN